MSLRAIPLSLHWVMAWARHALPPLLQGTRPRFASDTLMSLLEGIATPLGFHGSWPGRAIPFLRSCREPALAELGHPDVASEGIATPLGS